MVLILCPPLLGIYIKLICIVFMECLLELVNSTTASGWWCCSKHPGGSVVEYIRLSTLKYLTIKLGHKMWHKSLNVFYLVGSKAECDTMQTCRSAVFSQSRVVRVNVDQLHGESVHGMATDRLLMRPLSGLVLSSPPGAPVDVLYHISIEFHSTGLVYSKYICLN